MIRFRTEQEVDRPAEDVWAYAADIVRHPEWMGVVSARVASGSGTEVGARAVERAKLGPKTFDAELEVTESEPARRIAWRIVGGGPMAGSVAIDIEPLSPGRTRAVMSGSLGLTGILRLIEPLLAAEIRSGEAAELLRLKQRLESATPA